MSEESTRQLAEAVLAACRRKGMKLATAESCTGGMVAAALTDIAGSSDVVERGFVTYSNEAKTELLGVPPALIAAHGAVSAEVAAAMAKGALARASRCASAHPEPDGAIVRCRAMKVVDQTDSNWNRTAAWLRQLDPLRSDAVVSSSSLI